MPVRHRARRIATAAMVGGTVLSLCAVSAATPSRHHKPAPKIGLFVAHEPRITPNTAPASYVVDSRNYEHFVQFREGATGDGHIAYYSRKLKARSWTMHTAPGGFDLTGHPRLEFSAEGSNLYLVAYTCKGVYAVLFADSAQRLPQFTQVSSVSDCNASSTPQTMSAVFDDILYNQNLHVIVPDAEVDGQWDVLLGRPGAGFTQVTTVPRDHGFVPTQYLGNPNGAGGEVIGRGIDAEGNKGVYETAESYHWDSATMKYVDDWTDLTEVATLGSPTIDYTVESASFYGDLLDLGLYLPAGSRGQKHTLFIDERDATDQWSSPIPVPRTGMHDHNLILTTSPETAKLRATWERSIGSPRTARRTSSGIITERRLTSGWTPAVQESHWWNDVPLTVSYDRTGLPHFFYLQRR